MELKNYSTTVDNIITSGQNLVFRYLNIPIDLPDMIGFFASGATNYLVAQIGTKDLTTSKLLDGF